MKKFFKIFGKVIAVILAVILAFAIGLVIFLTVNDYKPEPVETVEVVNNEDKPAFSGDTVKLISFNTGFAGLGDNADFFMDGGKQVFAADEKRVHENYNEILDLVQKANADFYLLQEVDQNSKRTYDFNQVQEYLDQTNMAGTFGLNYSCKFVPYPVPPLGKINSGVMTLSNYKIDSAQRISLPCPFKWPVSTANLKRCLVVNRVPIENSDKQLVIIDLHLEAYDNGEGKAAQTKMLFSVLEEEYNKGNYVIAGGDFNQTFPGAREAYPIINDEVWCPGTLDNTDLPDGWRFAFDLSEPSCRLLNKAYDVNSEDNQHYVLDGYILSPNVEEVKVKNINLDFHAADHNPVYLEAKLK